MKAQPDWPCHSAVGLCAIPGRSVVDSYRPKSILMERWPVRL